MDSEHDVRDWNAGPWDFLMVFLILGDVSKEEDKGRWSGAMGECAKDILLNHWEHGSRIFEYLSTRTTRALYKSRRSMVSKKPSRFPESHTIFLQSKRPCVVIKPSVIVQTPPTIKNILLPLRLMHQIEDKLS